MSEVQGSGCFTAKRSMSPEDYRKRLYKTSYGHTFGRTVVDTGDVTILKFINLSELPCSKVLNPTVLAYCQSWIEKEKETQTYISKVIHFLRNFYTTVRT